MRWLKSLRGVGPWTAHEIAIEAFGHGDGVLVGDAGVPRLVTVALTGRAGGDEEMPSHSSRSDRTARGSPWVW